MTSNKRRAERISVELPVTVYLFDNKKKDRQGDAVAGRIMNFSPIGAALNVAAILLNGRHLFYACQDNPEIVLELIFDMSSEGETVNVLANPVWFDRDLGSEKKLFVLGLEFLTNPKSPAIKTLCNEVCRDEKMLISLWKKLF